MQQQVMGQTGWRKAEVAKDIFCPGICFGVPSLGTQEWGGLIYDPQIASLGQHSTCFLPLPQEVSSRVHRTLALKFPMVLGPRVPALLLLGSYCWANTGLGTSHGKDRQKVCLPHYKPLGDQERPKLVFFVM